MYRSIHLLTSDMWEVWLKPDGSQYYVSLGDGSPRYSTPNISRIDIVENITNNFKRWKSTGRIKWMNDEFKDYFEP